MLHWPDQCANNNNNGVDVCCVYAYLDIVQPLRLQPTTDELKGEDRCISATSTIYLEIVLAGLVTQSRPNIAMLMRRRRGGCIRLPKCIFGGGRTLKRKRDAASCCNKRPTNPRKYSNRSKAY